MQLPTLRIRRHAPDKYFIVQILVNIQIFPLVGGTRLRLVPPTKENICIYTLVKLYN